MIRLSVIVPAFNESKRIGPSLERLNEALRETANLFTSEIVVADNNSTDNTAALAKQAGARVVFEPFNQIAKARNAGGRAAQGDWLLFLDADTWISADTLRELGAFITSGQHAGGGTTLRYDRAPFAWKLLLWVSNATVIPWLKWTPGCLIFCRADVFRETGGFDETMFAGEDVEFGKAMRRWGKARGLKIGILKQHPPVTSIRKLDLYGSAEIFTLLFRWLLFPRRTSKDKSRLHVFYDGRR